jgi:hypothetical protein
MVNIGPFLSGLIIVEEELWGEGGGDETRQLPSSALYQNPHFPLELMRPKLTT